MADADNGTVRQNYVTAMQAVARLALQLNNALGNLNNFYLGAGLSGTFADSELATGAGTKHLTAGDVGTITTNLSTVQGVFTTPILQNMAKAVGNVP